jgi:clan AA aspartic protease (TIGR02281 family)
MCEIKKSVSVFILLTMVSFTCPEALRSEFFKYVDKDGYSYFVDDESKIPKEYRNNITVYKEKYDHLPEKQRSLMIREDRKRAQEIEKKRITEEKRLKSLELKKKRRREQIEKEKYLKSLETKVVINESQVLVPVRLGYKRKEIDTLLLLDTGASIIALHREVAKALDIRQTKRGTVQVAGGKVIDIKMTKLSTVKVGPIEKKDVEAGIIVHKGPPVTYQGLLGMNFLYDIGYIIDYKKQTIKWKP